MPQTSIAKWACAKNARLVVVIQEGIYKCNYCDETFKTPQGKASHEQMHKAKDDKLKRGKTPYGKVKYRDVQTKPAPAAAISVSGQKDSGRACATDMEIEGEDPEGDQLCEFFAAKEVDKDKGLDQDTAEVDREDEDTAQTDNRASGLRQRNRTPLEIVEVLDAWHAFVKEHGSIKKKFVREVMRNPAGFNQSKFGKNSLNPWLADEERIRASAKLHRADQRRLAIARESVGRCPDMELKLAASI